MRLENLLSHFLSDNRTKPGCPLRGHNEDKTGQRVRSADQKMAEICGFSAVSRTSTGQNRTKRPGQTLFPP